MKRFLIATALLLAAVPAFSQEGSAISRTGDAVTVTAKGHDIRDVLYDLFTQSGKNFVLDSGVRFVLYLNLDKVDFQTALDLVCENGKLSYDVKNGIYFISKKESGKSTTPQPTPVGHGGAAPARSAKGKVTAQELQKRITTRFSITDLRKVFEEFSKQTGIQIDVDASVPAYKVDAYLIDTSLKYGLDVLCEAAKLKWVATEKGTIKITKG